MVAASRADLLGRVRGMEEGMVSAIRQRTERVRLLMSQFVAETLLRNVRQFLQPLSQRADDAREVILQGLRETVTGRRHRWTLASRELSSYSPLDILSRGYAVVTHEPTGRILLSAEPAARGEKLSIRLSRGSIRATVEETHAGEKQ
jgi:exodeoxyribonuclease VII large subunit